jgi:hypothetical protein
METIFKCPACGWQTVGIIKNGCAPSCICSHCQQKGTTVFMLEQKKENICNVGGGLFTVKK